MATHLLKGPDTISATATPQAVTLPEPGGWYSIRNSGSGSVYYIAIDISNYTAATYTSVTAAALRTAGCGMVAAGESTAFQTDFPSIYIVCASGVTATVNIEPGIIASVTNIEANLGNVGLLNAAETEINPATSDLQTTGNAILTTMDVDTGNIDTKLGTVGGAADVDGAVTVQLRYIGEAVDGTEALLTTIDADTSKIPSLGTAVMTGATPVTMATDDTLTAAIKLDVDKIPSKGTAVMTGSTPVTIATDDTLTAAIKLDVDKIPSKGTAVMTGSTPVTLATDDTLVAAIKLDVDKIPSQGTAAMTASTPVTIATNDTVLLPITNSNQTLTFARIDYDLSGGTAQELVAGVASKFIYVVEFAITVDTQCELEFAENGTPTTLAPPLYFAQRGGIYMPRSPGYRFKTTTLAEGLDIDEVAGVSVKIRGYLWYYTAA